MSSFNIPWRTTAISVLLGGVTLFGAGAYAKTPTPTGLFSTVEPSAGARLPDQAIAGRTRSVKINHGRLRSGRFFVDLPGGVSFEAVRDLKQDLGQSRYSWTGHVNGNRLDRIVMGVSGDAVAATFAYRGKLYKLEPQADGGHQLSEVSTDDPAPEMDPIPVASNDFSRTNDAPAEADGGAVIDVLVAYTPKIKSIYGLAGTDALIIQAVAEANQAYANSGMESRLNLVAAVLTNYTESGDMGRDLSRLKSTSDGHMDELHALRDDLGADLVSLIENEPQYCGIAYRMASLSAGFASSAFSVVHRTCATGYYSFAHELGHNQGAHHDPANASGSAIYSYAYGHQDPGRNFRTVMAYNCAGGCNRVSHFSNPDVMRNGIPTGSANVSDNALTIDQTAATVASFRQAVAQNDPPAKPSGLTALAIDHNSMELDWVDNSDDESGFGLERSEDGLSFTQIASLAANTRSYQDDNLDADTLYYYRARAWSSAGNSNYSSVATAATVPAPPATDQVAKAEIFGRGSLSGTYARTWEEDGDVQTIVEDQGSKQGVAHKWVINVQPANAVVLSAIVETNTTDDTFSFYYSSDNSSWVKMFDMNADNAGLFQFTLPSTLDGEIYIRVQDNVRPQSALTSHYLSVDQLIIRSENGPIIPLLPPNAPDDLSASGSGPDQIDLFWSDRSDNEHGFVVERRTDGSGDWITLTATGVNTSSYTDTGLEAQTLYHYRVHAFNDNGDSPLSNSASALTDEESAGGEIELVANAYRASGKRVVDLTWSGAAGAKIDLIRDGMLRPTVNDGSWTNRIKRNPANEFSYQVCETGSTRCSNTVNVAF